ncbi:hypothetical protein [Actinocrispum wychmicini]|uniref:Rare lipoprotein A (RlpA)-like double-psi beta-barrel protein n=1 Tax=Actinocrispum wychmicini TaxID=1213861 RepID=A0A4V2S6N4_9PSEU|nr:hypothetical protein [Actinocrispum wychmicini]TCO56730.1 hypothetical protein EV192_106204 [Actinocrispum wychmicini]
MAPDRISVAATSEASWFCCGAGWGPCGSAGGGACGNCSSGSRHCAWPNTSDACFSITRPDQCGEDLLRWGCGHTFFVKHLCGSTEIAVTIRDCGPHTNFWCGEQRCCGGSCATDRLIDFTPAAFSVLGNLSSGLIPVTVHS